MTSNRTAFIVGGSRGLGLGLVKEYLSQGWKVITTERSPSSELHDLSGNAGDKLRIEKLDINDYSQIKALANTLKGEKLDLLFVNSGVGGDLSKKFADVDNDEFISVMVTNALSPMRVVEAFDSLVNEKGTIGVMTSGMGSISENTSGGADVYRASKAALNMLMKNYSLRTNHKRSLIAMMPGWVRTDMGGDAAPLDVATSTKGIAKTIAAHENKAGLIFVDYKNDAIGW